MQNFKCLAKSKDGTWVIDEGEWEKSPIKGTHCLVWRRTKYAKFIKDTEVKPEIKEDP